MDEIDKVRLDRRTFMTSMVAATALPAAAAAAQSDSGSGTLPESERLPSALPPNAVIASAETATPDELPRIPGKPGSDFMLDVIKSLDIKYSPANCASSFRALHESIINYGNNSAPEYLSVMHEEIGVAMAHGYFKITGKPIMTIVHGTVGLQHAAMAVYNAYCDRVPVILINGNEMDAAHRPTGVPTVHAAQDINLIVRDYTKWDDTPVSLQHFAQSLVRAYKIAMTPPYGPVAISLDSGLQHEPISDHIKDLYIPKFTMPSPPAGEAGAVREAARLLLAAENPVIVADRAARTPNGINLLVELAELLQAPVIGPAPWPGRMNFPNTHYLSRSAAAVPGADAILGLELSDFWGVVNSFTDNGMNSVGVNKPKIKSNVKLISISSSELMTKSNYQDFQRFQSVDVSMPADAEATLPTLIEEIRDAMTPEKRRAIEGKIDKLKKAYSAARAKDLQLAAIGWDASPISTARLCMETYAAVKDLDWSLVASEGQVSNWPLRLWNMEKHYHWLGSSGGYGIGYGAPASIGAALANRDLGRFSVAIQSDGDLMFAPGALWTAAKHKIPLLSVMHNNRAWHQEVMHVQRISNFRNRVANCGNDAGPVGTMIQNPDIEYHKLAESMGWWAKGPIKDPSELAPALKEAVEVVKRGQPALLNVWTQPR